MTTTIPSSNQPEAPVQLPAPDAAPVPAAAPLSKQQLIHQFHQERVDWNMLLRDVGFERLELASFVNHLHAEHEPQIRAWLK